MGEFTIKRWRCDRCGKVEDKRPYFTPRPEIVLGYSWVEGPGPVMIWGELCGPCTDYAHKLVDREIAAAKEPTNEQG